MAGHHDPHRGDGNDQGLHQNRTKWEEGHGINSVAFSPDGKTIVSGSEDQTIKVWDAGVSALTHPTLT